MAVNTGKVVVGGLAAGVVLNVIDFVVNMFVFGDRFKAQLDAINPVLSTNLNSTNSMVAFVVIDFLLGFCLVWTYAAIRPRFGAGPGTAVKAGLLIWVVTGAVWFFNLSSGMMDVGLYAMGATCALVNVLVASLVGAAVYKEE